MALGADLSKLSRDAHAAQRGLSIVVPVFNEARGLNALHQRIGEMAKALRERRAALRAVYVDDGSVDETLTIAQALPADAARRAGDLAVAQFRQGGRADGRSRPCSGSAR